MLQNNKITSNHEYTDCCLICTSLIIGLSFASCLIAYFITGIVFLVEDYDKWRDCTESNIWIYVLISLILFLNSGYVAKNNELKNSDYDSLIKFIVMILMEISMVIWGAVELLIIPNYDNCQALQNSNLWYHAVLTFSLNIIFVAFTFIFICIMYYLYIPNVVENEKNIEASESPEETNNTE